VRVFEGLGFSPICCMVQAYLLALTITHYFQISQPHNMQLAANLEM
jgi:hypothetical protein